MAFTTGNDINILQGTDLGIVGAGAGNDRYVLDASTLTANQRITLNDSQGTNTLQLAGGLSIVSSQVTANAVQLTLNNGAVIIVLGASTFSFQTGGNVLNGTGGLTQTFGDFVTASLGLATVPTGAAPVAGGPVTVQAAGGTTGGGGVPGATYALTAGAAAADEGTTATFNLATTGLAAGAEVAYTLSGVQAADVVGGLLTGKAVVGADGKATISVALAADGATEGAETLTVTAGGKTATTTVNDTSNAVPPSTLTLTIGENRLTGGAGNDTFNALAVEQQGAGGSKATLESFDLLNGGEGMDTLNATLTKAGAAPILQSIEVVNARFAGAQTLNLTSATGVQSINVQTSTVAGIVDGVGAAANLAVKNQLVDATFDKSTAATLNLGVDTVGVATAANVVVNLAATVAAKATTLNITANNAFAKVDSAQADTASTLTIAATGTNRLNLVDLGASAKSITITGAGSVDLLGDAVEVGTALTGALATFNGSAAEGAIKADIRSTALATVTTGKGADWIDMDTVVTAGSTVNLGAGNDTLLTGGLLANFAKVDGGEGTDTINITEGTAALTAANAKLINNFEVLDVSGGKTNYDVSLNSFATVQIDEAINGALTGAVDFKNAADTFTLNVASKTKTNADFVVGQTIAVTGKDYTGTTALGSQMTIGVSGGAVELDIAAGGLTFTGTGQRIGPAQAELGHPVEG